MATETVETLTIDQIVDEMVEWYNGKARRSFDLVTGSCYYRNTDGNMCAIGRTLSKEVLALAEEKCNDSSVKDLLKAYNRSVMGDDYKLPFPKERLDIDVLLKPQYHGHFLDFWEKLQILHDKSNFWCPDTNELTEIGKAYVEIIKDVFSGRDVKNKEEAKGLCEDIGIFDIIKG